MIMTSVVFPLTSDLEFYCFLKLSLQRDYQIISEPRTSYYSEWEYCYKLYWNNEIVKTYEGNFLEIEPGMLVREAEILLQELGNPSVNWK